MEISGFLDHLEIGQSQKDLWTVRVAGAICNYKHALDSEKNRTDYKTQRIALQIQNFSRSITRQPKTSTLNKRWQQLPREAHIFINFQLKSISNRFIDFGDLDLSVDADQQIPSTQLLAQ